MSDFTGLSCPTHDDCVISLVHIFDPVTELSFELPMACNTVAEEFKIYLEKVSILRVEIFWVGRL